MPRFACRLAALSLGIVLASAGAAQADDVYVNFFGGLNIVPGQDLAYEDAGPPAFGFLTDGTVSYDKGLGFGAAVGYAVDVGAGFALYGEAEVSYRTNSIDFNEGIDEDGDVEAGDEDGHSNILAGMANLGLRYRVVDGLSLHAAGGVGYARWSYGYDANPDDPLVVGPFEGDDQGSFAWQAIAGLGYEVAPGFEVGFEYRYFAIGDESFVHTYNGSPLRDDTSYDSHSVFATFRVEFSPLLRAFGVR
jgi:opacity protein-like surface antigen